MVIIFGEAYTMNDKQGAAPKLVRDGRTVIPKLSVILCKLDLYLEKKDVAQLSILVNVF